VTASAPFASTSAFLEVQNRGVARASALNFPYSGWCQLEWDLHAEEPTRLSLKWPAQAEGDKEGPAQAEGDEEWPARAEGDEEGPARAEEDEERPARAEKDEEDGICTRNEVHAGECVRQRQPKCAKGMARESRVREDRVGAAAHGIQDVEPLHGEPLHAELAVSAGDDRHGVLLLHVLNSGKRTLNVSCFLPLPWQIMPLWHSLRVERGADLQVLESALLWLKLAPGPMRSAQHMQWGVTLMGGEAITIALHFEALFLHIDELPADASRGVDVWGGMLRYTAVNESEYITERIIYTNGVLLPVPLADMSMPYNVISITSTLLTLFVGSMFSLLTRP